MNQNDLINYSVMRRDGNVVPFAPEKIGNALAKAFLYNEDGLPYVKDKTVLSPSEREKVSSFTESVVKTILTRKAAGGTIHIEELQDLVELMLMRSGEHAIARGYVLYRSKRASERYEHAHPSDENRTIRVKAGNGDIEPINLNRINDLVSSACEGLADVSVAQIIKHALTDLYDGITDSDVQRALIMSARSKIEKEPNYSYVASRLMLDSIRSEVLGEQVSQAEMSARYADCFPTLIKRGVGAELLDEKLLQFDLIKLGQALKAERDTQFKYLGLQTLYDRYFLHIEDRRIELPQVFFMRVAMGLSINEIDRESSAIEFYNVLSSFDFMSSTPTLFNSGSRRSQLSSCYLTTVPDDLDGIYEAIKENALLSKFAGGLGNDWTNVRSLGAVIKGTNGKSQGVVPFLKVVNDTAVAVNQGGKRKGAVCAYLESWHLDIEEFLEMRKNTGDDRRRTHDMNTANWIPDLFMRRVMENGDWTLFSPSDVPDLHDKFGIAFESAYVAYEEKAARGEIKLFKKIPAVQLWRKMLSMLFETGHPWITFKDPCNIRSPQQHIGVVRSSNLCTEITLNTNDQEIAVCNLGSVNLVNHLKPEGGLDAEKLKKTVNVAMRMLDNVIDINFYAVAKARNSNLKHRPVGLGIMGFQDCLHKMRIPYGSGEAVKFADSSMEMVSYYAYWASSELAEMRGKYASYKGSLWDQGIMPLDSMKLLADERGGYLESDISMTLDWDALRNRIQQFGIRNSNCVAIAPTATIANIVGVSASIEPTYQNLYVKSNLSGEFTVVNEYLVKDLKDLGIWDDVMVADIKYFDGSIGKIDRIPEKLRSVYATAFEVDPTWIIECAARRQKWIDQAQSLNIYMAGASGKKLDETYKLAWIRGLKTTYYLRTLGATSAEKSTGRGGELNAVSSTSVAEVSPVVATDVKYCSIDNPDCESCQ